MLPAINLCKADSEHFQVDVVSIHKDHPQDAVVAVRAVTLDVNHLIQNQTGKLPCGLLAKWLSRFLLLA